MSIENHLKDLDRISAEITLSIDRHIAYHLVEEQLSIEGVDEVYNSIRNNSAHTILEYLIKYGKSRNTTTETSYMFMIKIKDLHSFRIMVSLLPNLKISVINIEFNYSDIKDLLV